MQGVLRQGRIAGALLVASAVLSLAALTHHPVVRASTASLFVKDESAFGPLIGVFHGFMIVVIFALYVGLVVYSRSRGLQSTLVLAALIAATIGLGAEACAALIDGFFAPGFGAYLARTASASGTVIQIVWAAALGLQILARFGAVAVAVAIAFWSINLFDGNRDHLVFAAIGGVSAVGSFASLSTVASSITPHNAALVFGMQALWYATAGSLMLRESV